MKCFAVILLLTSICFSGKDLIQNVWVDDFESSMLEDWYGRQDGYEEIYHLDSIEDNRYLTASSLNTDNFIIKKVDVDLVQYPYLNWKWRANSLPLDGDESIKKRCDIAASINVVLRASKWRPQTIKYTWSTTLDRNTITKSPFAYWPSRADIIVLQSGDEHLHEWVTEKVNVLEHYKQLYNKDEVKKRKVEAFVIMTDSDNTGSLSAADYDDIFFSKD